MRGTLAFVLATLTFASASFGQIASDNAANYGTTANWTNGSNQGFGFGPWTINDGTNNSGGHYIGATGLGANTFGIFNTFDEIGDSVTDVIRPFNAPLGIGQTFTIQLGFNQQPASSFGIDLRSGNNVAVSLILPGGQAGTPRWMLNDGGSNFDAGSDAIANTPYTFSFTFNGGQSYSFTLTGGPGGSNFTAQNNFVGSIDNLRIFNFNQGPNGNFGFDNLAIVPEPTTVSLLAGPAILGALFFARRRRS